MVRTFLFTCSTHERRRFFQFPGHASIALDAICHYEQIGKYTLHATVVMPDHIHVLFTPPEEITLERIAGMLKGGISFRLREQIRWQLWEDGYHDVRMRDREQTIAAANYVRDNPATAGLKDWPFVVFNPATI